MSLVEAIKLVWMGPLWAMAAEKRPLLWEEMTWERTDQDPALSPKMVTFLGLPPKSRMLA